MKKCAKFPKSNIDRRRHPHFTRDRAYICGVLWFILHLVFCQLGDGIMKHLGQHIPSVQVIFLRFFFATLWLLPILVCKARHYFRTACPWIHVLRGGILCLALPLFCKGLQGATLPLAAIVSFSGPLFLLVMAKIFLGEHISQARTMVTVLGFFGIVIVAEPLGHSINLSVLLLLCSVALFAAADIINKKFATRESMVASLFYTALTIALFLSIPACIAWQPMDLRHWVCTAILGAGADMLFFCIIRSFRLIQASTSAPYRYIEFLLSILNGYIFFGEIPSVPTLIGAAIIIPATLFLAYTETHRKLISS